VGFGERSIPSPEPLTSGTSLSRERRSRADRLKSRCWECGLCDKKKLSNKRYAEYRLGQLAVSLRCWPINCRLKQNHVIVSGMSRDKAPRVAVRAACFERLESDKHARAEAKYPSRRSLAYGFRSSRRFVRRLSALWSRC